MPLSRRIASSTRIPSQSLLIACELPEQPSANCTFLKTPSLISKEIFDEQTPSGT